MSQYEIVGAYTDKTVYIDHATQTLKIRYGNDEEKVVSLDNLIKSDVREFQIKD